jgi:septum formation protein
MRIVLASASPARLAILRAAGLSPEVVVSGVEEDDVTGSPAEMALTLARRKAQAVSTRLGFPADVAVIGCDSLLDVDGEPFGKPPTLEAARGRWRVLAGREATLVTGHAVIVGDTEVSATASTVVRFGVPTPTELDAYLASGEPLAVAGAFTLDGLGGWFVAGVDGAPSTVVGLSLPLLRGLLARHGIPISELWAGRTI